MQGALASGRLWQVLPPGQPPPPKQNNKTTTKEKESARLGKQVVHAKPKRLAHRRLGEGQRVGGGLRGGGRQVGEWGIEGRCSTDWTALGG